MIGFCTAPSRLSAMERTTVSMRVGSCHETTDPLVTPMACEAGGHPLGPVAELPEGEGLAVRRDEHGVIGRRLGPALDQLPHGLGAGQYLAGARAHGWLLLVGVRDAGRGGLGAGGGRRWSMEPHGVSGPLS